MQVIEAAKKRGQEKAKLTKSMIILDVKPWDDTTGTAQNPHHKILGSKVVLHSVTGVQLDGPDKAASYSHPVHWLQT